MSEKFSRRSVLGYAAGGAAGAVLLTSAKPGHAANDLVQWSVKFVPPEQERSTDISLQLREDHPLKMIGGASSLNNDHTSTYKITRANGKVVYSPPLADYEPYIDSGQQVSVTVHRTYPRAAAEEVFGSVTVDPNPR